MNQFIICSAIKIDDLVIGGRRHHNAFEVLEKLRPDMYKDPKVAEKIICGFIDNYGKFHTRDEAWVIADKADQIRFGKTATDPNNPILISEHLFDDLEREW
jgi:hypothetical protein